MSRITIVTGCPGTGKTTLAARLAQSATQGIHLTADSFFAFLARPIEPIRPESHGQNEVVTRAIARAARTFAEGGYETLVDGIVGPWFLPVFARELDARSQLEYVVLRAGLDETLERAASRPDAPPARVVRHMFAAFGDLGELEPHVVEAAGLSPDAVLAQVRARRPSGAFRLDVPGLAGRGRAR